MDALVSVCLFPPPSLSLGDSHMKINMRIHVCVYVVALGRHNKFVAQAYAHPQNEIGQKQ